MAQFSTDKVVYLHRNKPNRSPWSVCEHFQSIDNMINYYETLGGLTFINRTIVCEDCYEKIRTGSWTDVSASTHDLDEKSFREIFNNLALLKAQKDYLD